jgi:hypothetical protein
MRKKCESIAPLGEFGEVYEKYSTKLTSGSVESVATILIDKKE